MTAEKKKAQQDKIEDIDAVAKCKKTNREYMKRCCKAESIDKSAKHKTTNREYMKICRKAESIDVAATRKKIIRENMKRHCMAESHDAAAAQRSNGNTSKKRKHHGWQHNVSTVCNYKEMTNAIKYSMKKTKQIIHRTQDPANPHCHRAIVCIICDQFIISTETIHKLTNNQISKHSNRLSVQTYESYHGQVLKPEVKKQYQVNVDGLKTCSYHLDQGNIMMVMPLVPAATRECALTWQTREPRPNLPWQKVS
jgi:hypothetical protein